MPKRYRHLRKRWSRPTQDLPTVKSDPDFVERRRAERLREIIETNDRINREVRALQRARGEIPEEDDAETDSRPSKFA